MMSDKEIQNIVLRAEDEYERLKDRVHDLYDENKKLKEEIERLKEILDVIHEEIKYLYRKPKRLWYDDIQTLKTINAIVEKEIKGADKE